MGNNVLQRALNKIAYFAPGGFTFRPWLHKKRGVKIGNNVWISQFVYIDENHPEIVEIGDNCTIGIRTSIITHFYWGPRRDNNKLDRVIIENEVFVGPHCVILPGVRIGEGSVIKGGTVVSRNVPPRTFFGIPSPVALGMVTVPLTSEHEYSEFLKGLKPLRKEKTKIVPR